MMIPVTDQKPTKGWTSQVSGAYVLGFLSYVLGGLSMAGILGGLLNHDGLEIHDAFVTLMVAIGGMVFVRFMMWWRRN